MVLDDMDVCQLLPIRGDQFEQGVRNCFSPRCMYQRKCSNYTHFHTRFTYPQSNGSGLMTARCSSCTLPLKRTLSSYLSNQQYCFRMSRTLTCASVAATLRGTLPCIRPQRVQVANPESSIRGTRLHSRSWTMSWPRSGRRSLVT